MSSSEANKAAIAANRKTIFNIESNVLSNKALVYQSRSMIEENRLMIMSNYSAAFMGNRQLANANTDEILGVHMIGPRAADLIAEAVVAMEYRASAEDIARICHPHPTFTEAFKEAALDATDKRALHI